MAAVLQSEGGIFSNSLFARNTTIMPQILFLSVSLIRSALELLSPDDRKQFSEQVPARPPLPFTFDAIIRLRKSLIHSTDSCERACGL